MNNNNNRISTTRKKRSGSVKLTSRRAPPSHVAGDPGELADRASLAFGYSAALPASSTSHFFFCSEDDMNLLKVLST